MAKKRIKYIYPLSPMQSGMLFHSMRMESSHAYFLQNVFTIYGSLDPRLLEKSFQLLVERYDIFRTVFREDKTGKSLQFVLNTRKCEIEYEDISGLAAGEREARLESFKNTDKERGFDLSRDMLMRISLFKMEPGVYTLVWSFHHILMDGWCLGLVFKELVEVYRSLRDGRSPQLPTAIPYRDYILWLEKQDKEEALGYWETYLEGLEEPSVLPASEERADGDYRLEEVRFALDEELTAQLDQLARENSVTINTIFQILWGMLLQRYNNSEDVVFGAVVSGRPPEVAGIAEMIGLFINTVPVRIRLQGGKSFRQLLQIIHRENAVSRRYEYFPLAEIQARSPLKTRLIDHLMVFENYPVEEMVKEGTPGQKDDFVVEEMALQEQTGYNFNIMMAPGKRIIVKFSYNGLYYNKPMMERLRLQLETLVRGAVAAPDTEPACLPLIAPQERDKILEEFNNTDTPLPHERTLQQIFRRQAEHYPEHTALVDGERSISYRDLALKVEHRARLLRKTGVTSGSVVGILVHRSVDMMVGILGILSVGAAYMPMLPGYPPERVGYMLRDGCAALLLTHDDLDAGLDWPGEIQLLDMDTDSHPEDGPAVGDVHRSRDTAGGDTSTAAHPAYIIYTSGSTGKPKGVLVEHRAIINTLTALQNRYPLDNYDSYMLKTAYVFDVSLAEIFGWFFGTGRLVILPRGEEKEPGKILHLVYRRQITHINFVPSMLNAFLGFPDEDALPQLASLKYIFTAGEALPAEMVNTFRGLSLNCRLENIYGPTEAAIYGSWYGLADWSGGNIVPIGTPLPNVKLLIIDGSGNLNPIGVPGELCISGAGLARGYLNNPEMTAEKFIHHPLVPGSRLYRTGDLARFLADGNIAFMGRIDHQVKIRGFRIEPGEIENRLLQHPLLKEVVVIPRERARGDTYLCAYVVSTADIVPPATVELREYLAAALPDYMIPSYFVALDQLPSTATGKVDRKALPEPEVAAAEYTAPAGEIEIILAEVWQEVLGLPRIGGSANFFEIGGDSIKSIQIVSRLNQAGFKVGINELFKYPTIARLAPFVQKITHVPDQSPVTGNVTLTPIQHWFFQSRRRIPHHFNQAVMLFSERGFDCAVVRKVFATILKHHDALRITFPGTDNADGVNLEPGQPAHIEEHDLRGSFDAPAELEAQAQQIQAGIHLAKGPLLKLGLFHMDDGDRLLIVIHHLVVDGVSWRILFEDIETLYHQYNRGESPALPRKSDSFKVWAEELRRYADSPRFLEEKTYWAHSESIRILLIPVDNNEAGNTGKDVEGFSFRLDEEETKLLLTTVNEPLGTEINDILLTALALGVEKSFGIQKIVVAVEGHGREELFENVDINRTVGWFTSLFPVVLDISCREDLTRRIKEVKETLRRIPNKGIGYGILKYLSSADNKKEISFQVRPQILFNYLGQFDRDVERGAFTVSEKNTGYSQDLEESRDYELDVSGMVVENRLKIQVIYNKNRLKTSTVEGLAAHFKEGLRLIISHCSAMDTRQLTPSDVTCAELSIDMLDALALRFPLEDVYPLSPMQSGMYFHSRYDRSSAAYFEQISYRMQGNLDAGIMEATFNELCRRHDILRTAFINEEGGAMLQVVLKERTAEFLYKDFRGLGDDAVQEKHIEEFKEKDRRRSFALDSDTLMRSTMLHLSDREYEVVWSYHHILMDGWCLGLLMAEFFEIYNSLREKRPLRLNEPPPYKEYIQWLSQRDKKASGQYWQEYLEDYEETATVPGSGTGANDTRYEDAEYSAFLHGTLSGRLQKLAGKLQVTLNTVIQAAWGILLGMYNYRKDVVFGSVVSGRPAAIRGVENMIGLFINTIPVRIRFNKNTSFTLLAGELQEQAISSEPHHYYPLADIQSASPLKQNLLDHILVFENYPVAKAMSSAAEETGRDEDDKLELSNVRSFERSSYHFNIILLPGEQLEVRIKYNGCRYTGEEVADMADIFLHMLAQVSLRPKDLIKDISLLSEERQKQVLLDFNDRESDYPGQSTIPTVFRDQVKGSPDRIAVVFKDKTLTYKELDRRSDVLTLRLRERGVAPGDIVALMAHKSLSAAIALLAILKAGAAYLPIGPDYPPERKNYMLRDSNSSLLLKGTDEPVSVGEECAVMDLNLSTVSPDDREVPEITAEALFHKPGYVLYTSGSTGRPKGVLVEHRCVLRLVINSDFVQINAGERILQTGALEFDASTFEVWGTLLNGLSLYFEEKENILDARRLKETLQKYDISTIWLTAPFFNRLAGIDAAMFRGLKNLLVGGDILSPPHINRVKRECGELNIINGYGPTENTTFSTTFSINREYDGRIPIGRPINNSRCYIMGRYGRLLPVGVPGELWVGGDGVATGYLNNPEMTAEKFTFFQEQNLLTAPVTRGGDENPPSGPIPTGSTALTTRVYRTGDLARWLPDGNIDFIGRIDQQVKIRGFRIEPGEIENRLLECTGVKESFVLVREDGGGERYLCAYVVPEAGSGQEPGIPDLKKQLGGLLPDYMIPSYFIQMEVLPLTPNGKVDRRALPVPETTADSTRHIAPRNQREERLAAAWADVLGIDTATAGIDDDFFMMGGHSLKATVLISKIHKEFDVDVPLVEIFENPTIRAMAQYIEKAGKQLYQAMQPVEKREYYPLSAAQKRLYVLQQMEPGNTAYNLPQVIRIQGACRSDKLETTFKQLILRHESLRTSFFMMNEKPAQRIEENVPFTLHCYRCQDGDDGRVEDIVAGFSRPFDLSRAPLLQVGLVETGKNDYLLMLDMHHVITDGVSQGILIKDFMDIYSGHRPAPPTIQYKDYSQWQNSCGAKKSMKRQETFWLEEFSGEIPLLNLPTNYTRPTTQTFAGRRFEFTVEEPEAGKLRQRAQESGATHYMILLAVFTILLAKLDGGQDIIVGSPVAGRRFSELEPVVGMFVNMLVLRNFPSDDKHFNQFLQEVKTTSLKAFENQDYQFEDLVDKVAVKRDAGRNPLFDVAFALQNMEKSELAMEGLKLLPYEIEGTVSRFDMTLTGVDSPQRFLFGLEYCSKLFNEAGIRRFCVYFTRIISAITADPQVRLKDIDIVGEEEKEQILSDLNRVPVTYPESKTVQEIFRDRVTEGPDRVAVIFEDIKVSYRELDRRADCLAVRLREKGVRPETIVGLVVERSAEMLTGILAVIKAGGGYMPIDHHYPADRIRYMLADSKCAFLLAQMELVEAIGFSGECIDIAAPDTFQGEPRLEPLTLPSHLLYIIYTSGTTGKPKGTIIDHHNVVRLMFTDNYLFDFNSRDIWTVFHSYCFDFSVWEMYGPLLYGGRAVIVSRMAARDTPAFLEILKREAVTVLNQTPSAFYGLLNEELKVETKELCLRYVIFGGEALSPGKLKEWWEKYPVTPLHGEGTRLINMFGITETTVHVTYKEVGEEDIRLNISNIGKPIPTLSCFVLDRYLRLQPPLVAGELCVGGEGVARGYLNRPELSAEKFVPDPYCPGKLLYRSGDLGRLLENGHLEYLGRIDKQVKIRGFRIEPGEIENRLTDIPEVREAVVIPREAHGIQGEDSRYLCAYLVADRQLKVSELRERLAGGLPDYMIPAYFVHLDNIPLTPNGKVDRAALPEPGYIREAGEYTAPRNAVEERLASVWQDVLGVEKAGITDNFFELGGDSIKAVQVAARLRKYGLELKITDIFVYGTIGELSPHIGEIPSETAGDSTPPDTGLENIAPEQLEKITREIRTHIIDDAVVQAVYSLNPMQMGMLFHAREIEGSDAYFEQNDIALEGDISLKSLTGAFNLLFQRYDILRTVFLYDGLEVPMQVVLEKREVDIHFEDTTHMAKAEQTAYLDRFKLEDRSHGFSLDTEILMRMTLIKTGEKRSRLIWSFHHILMDGWCIAIIFRELVQFYSALSEGRTPSPAPVTPYINYIRWLESRDTNEGLQYWERYLTDYDILTVLPYMQEGDKTGYHAAEYDLLLDEALSSSLVSIAGENRVTLNTLFQTLWGVLLQRYNNSDDAVFGVVVSGRPPEIDGIEDMVGLFINTIPLRVRTRPQTPAGEDDSTYCMKFGELLRDIQENAVLSRRYEYLPLAEIQSRSPFRGQLIDHILVFENFPVNEDIRTSGSEGSMEFAVAGMESFGRSDYPLNVAVVPGRRIMVKFCYDASRFPPEGLVKMALHYRHLLQQAADDSLRPVESFEIITEEERQKVLFDLNDTRREYPGEKTAHRLFEDMAVQRPDGAAVVYVHQVLTYGELNRRSDRLALRLSEKGCGIGTIAALMVERSADMMVVLLAVLKAGGAYMPIESEYPDERKQYMLKDSAARLLLTAGPVPSEPHLGLTTIDITDPGLYAEGEPSERSGKNETRETGDSQLVYVLYTSGSTGRPKGVLVTHKNVVRLVKNTNFVQFNAGEHLLQTGALGFDASTFEIWGALLNGLTLYLAQKDTILDTSALKELLHSRLIDTIWLTAPFFNRLCGIDISLFAGLKNLLVGGDVLSPPHINRVKVRYPDLKIINGYGPTENTTFSATFHIRRKYRESIPIGEPINNSTCYIVGRKGELQPEGVPGELWLGGDGLARGYLNNPELTGDVFVPFPVKQWGADTGAGHWARHGVLYRTGDLVCRPLGGNIEFVGRIDQQVKIRGFRIEPGEIESCLLEMEAVREAFVTDLRDESGEKYLCAYVVAENDNPVPDDGVLRKYLEGILPHYMVPSYFVSMEKLPLNPNGKIDRRALPLPGTTDTTGEYIAPRNEREKQLVWIWSEILAVPVEKIGMNADFFQLGGHSLKATILVARIHKAFNVKISLTDIFTSPTVKLLTQCIDASSEARYASILPVEKKEYYPLSSAQERLYVVRQMTGADTAYNMPQVMELSSELDIDQLENSFKQLLLRHESLRTSFKMVGELPVQEIHDVVDFSMERHGFDAPSTPDETEAIVAAFVKPFHLDRAPLLRVELVKTTEAAHVLLVDMHHIISDGTSMGIILKEFEAFYSGLTLPPLKIQYKDYSEWQFSDKMTAVIGRQEAFWQEELAGEIPVLNLPYDFTRPALQSFEGDSVEFPLSP
ncbi:MAG: amino acid adenylation domain-containing protein, partial [bacterium]|nr:amino acid adenylation domain-containing protein [bacterium]